MKEYNSLVKIAEEIKKSDKKVTLLYAFNATGKTRLSMEFKNIASETRGEETIKRVIYYNAFTEDLFSWDNDLDNDVERKIIINTKSKFIDLIKEHGKENEIANRFRKFTSSKIEPSINTNGEVVFKLPTGDGAAIDNIKISKGEERVFVWSVFFVLMETIISQLELNVEDRITSDFNEINYIYIDDPISSLDDNYAIDLALELKKLISSSEKGNLRFVISTHHALFYNVLHTKFSKAAKWWLSKDDEKYILRGLEKDSTPFGYHLLLKEELKNAVKNDNIKRYHFNLFRNLLETTALFLGYDTWKDIIRTLIQEEDQEGYIKRIDFYSHSDYSTFEPKELEPHEKQFLLNLFNLFVSEYKWKE